MKEKKSQLCPKYVYRVDRRSPEEIFRNGFTPLGTNNNLITHILGHSISRHTNLHNRSYFISTSDNIDSAVRRFGVLSSVDHDENTEYYVYKIRANKLVYSVLKTINYFLSRIKKRNISFQFGDYVLAQEIVQHYFRNFAYLNEWVNVGEIEPTRIKSAQKINFIDLNKNHLENFRDTCKKFIEIDDEEIYNIAFSDEETCANFLPYNIEYSNNPKTNLLSLTDTLFLTDVGGGVWNSLAFACDLDIESNNYLLWRERERIENSPFGHCHIDLALINKILNNNYDLDVYKESKPIYSLIHLFNELENNNYLLSWSQINNKYTANLVNEEINGCYAIYDNYQRIALQSSSNNISYCLTAVPTDAKSIYEIDFKVATTNDYNQKFYFELYRNDAEKILLRVKSKAHKNYSLHVKKNEVFKKLYLLDNNKPNESFNEIYIEISKNKTLSNFVLQQRAATQLLDVRLAWTYARQYYIPNPENGYSTSSVPQEKMFFYDLNTFKIVYVNKNNETFFLYNKRYPHSSPKWDWIRWTRNQFFDNNENREKWYFEFDSTSLKKEHMNFKMIRSFENNDWLKVMLFGANWGSFLTTNIQNDDSINTFFIADDALL